MARTSLLPSLSAFVRRSAVTTSKHTQLHSVPGYPSVELFAWQPPSGARNFGDHLSHIIAAAVARERGMTFDDEISRPRRMLGDGSILHFARNGDTIWGSGVNGKISLDQIVARQLDVRAVRGPKTADVLRSMGIKVPAVYGDPALLLPRYFGKRFRVAPVRDYIFIPNLNDLKTHGQLPNLMSPLRGWNRCVEAICGAKLVIASSLHAIILAEAFGVPARYVRLTETESQFKYDDYAQSTGRRALVPAYSIAEAREMGGHEPIHFDPKPLLDAFPYDLWA
jgi:pyruvyltransferase